MFRIAWKFLVHFKKKITIDDNDGVGIMGYLLAQVPVVWW